jgi:hypothetical protein
MLLLADGVPWVIQKQLFPQPYLIFLGIGLHNTVLMEAVVRGPA